MARRNDIVWDNLFSYDEESWEVLLCEDETEEGLF